MSIRLLVRILTLLYCSRNRKGKKPTSFPGPLPWLLTLVWKTRVKTSSGCDIVSFPISGFDCVHLCSWCLHSAPFLKGASIIGQRTARGNWTQYVTGVTAFQPSPFAECLAGTASLNRYKDISEFKKRRQLIILAKLKNIDWVNGQKQTTIMGNFLWDTRIYFSPINILRTSDASPLPPTQCWA